MCNFEFLPLLTVFPDLPCVQFDVHSGAELPIDFKMAAARAAWDRAHMAPEKTAGAWT